jgi:sulfur carrier protein
VKESPHSPSAPGALRLRVNGTDRELPANSTVADLLAVLGVPRDGLAVAISGRVIPKGEHPSQKLADGDVVEVIRAVGGG